jgi:hypothetical protein
MGHLEVAELLIAAGADVSATNNVSRPLHSGVMKLMGWKRGVAE